MDDDRIEGPFGYLLLYDDVTVSVTLYQHEKKAGRPRKNNPIKIFAEGDEEIVYHLPRQLTRKGLEMIGAL